MQYRTVRASNAAVDKMQVKTAGEFNGKRVDEITLESTTGVRVSILTWGVTVRDWQVPAHEGLRSIVLGFQDFAPYPLHSPHLGSLSGRIANRVANAQFTLDGTTYHLDKNHGEHTIHGGDEGLGRTVWDLDTQDTDNTAILTHFSPHGHMGFPGNINLKAIYSLNGNTLSLHLSATTDRPTPLSIVQHHYFNLGLSSQVLDHKVQIPATAYSEVDDQLIPSGTIFNVKNTNYDFRTPRILRDALGQPIDYDVNLVLPTRRDLKQPIAIVSAPENDLTLRLWSNQPAVQLYNAVTTAIPLAGLNNKHYGNYSGLCLEDQKYPGAVANPHFPSTIITPDSPYNHHCTFEIA